MAVKREKVIAAAERYTARGQHERAAKEYQSLVDADPKDLRCWLLLAESLKKANRVEEAIEKYQHVAAVYAQNRDQKKALAVYRQILTLDPRRLDIQLRCAELFDEIGQRSDAMALFERVAQAYLKGGKVQEAIALYKQVAEAEPTQVAKRLRLAELYSREKLFAEAVQEFQISADQLHQEERFEEYVRVSERLLYHDKERWPELRRLTHVYLQVGQPRRALMKLNVLLQIRSTDAEGLELLAETMHAMGKVDKAISVVVELARGLGAGGSDEDPELRRRVTARAVQRALGWAPDHPDLIAARARVGGPPTARVQPGPPPPSPAATMEAEVVELVEDDELVELDEDAIELEEEGIELEDDAVEVSSGRPSSAPGSLTREVMSEVAEQAHAAFEDAGGDLDKLLQEARVLRKYRLFEHALAHVEEVLSVERTHRAGLEVKAEILVDMDRGYDAAELYVMLADLTRASDPGKARGLLEAALAAVPDHGPARQLLDALGDEGAGGSSGEVKRPTTAPQDVVPELPDPEMGEAMDLDEGFDDTGFDDGFGLVEDEFDDEGEAIAVDGDGFAEPVDELGIETPASEPPPEAPAVDLGPGPTETPSLEPVATATEDDVGFELDDGLVIPQGRPAAGDTIDPGAGEGGISLSLADPGLSAELVSMGGGRPAGAPAPPLGSSPTPTDQSAAAESHDDLEVASDIDLEPDLDLDVEEGSYEPEAEPDLGPIVVEDRFGLEDEDEGEAEAEADIEDEAAVEPELAVAPEPAHAAEQPPAATPPPPGPPPGGWPDIEDELSEIEFFLMQDLADDAKAAYEDLARKYPGHPELAEVAKELGIEAAAAAPAAQPVHEPAEAARGAEAPPADDVDAGLAAEEETEVEVAGDASEPIFDFSDDEDDDDFLSGIFDDAPVKREQKQSSAGARAELSEADASTHFDLGLAYVGMGLVGQAVGEFDKASGDPEWRARALIQKGKVMRDGGELLDAVECLLDAVDAARNDDERAEARFELGVTYEQQGDKDAALAAFEQVSPSYPDRDERIAALKG